LVEALSRVRAITAAGLCFAQAAHLPACAAADLVRAVVATVSPEAWTAAMPSGTRLASWPAGVCAELLRAVRAIPPGPTRIEAFCSLAGYIEEDERREALEGILGGVSPRDCWVSVADLNEAMDGALDVLELGAPDGRKAADKSSLHARLIQRVCDSWRDEFVARRLAASSSPARSKVTAEVHIRREINYWPEPDVRRLWAALHEARPHTEVLAGDAFFVLDKLPPDLCARALSRIRACRVTRERLHYLSQFDDELTPAERVELVQTVRHGKREDPRDVAGHLRSVSRHLANVPYEIRVGWLDEVSRFSADSSRDQALSVLAPLLEGRDRARALAMLVESARAARKLYALHGATHLLAPADTSGLLALAVRQRGNRGIAHALVSRLAEFDDAAQDAGLGPLVRGLSELAPRTRVFLATDAAWWTATRTQGAFPLAFAEHVISHPARLRAARQPDPVLPWDG
jgi:hypothetical protein